MGSRSLCRWWRLGPRLQAVAHPLLESVDAPRIASARRFVSRETSPTFALLPRAMLKPASASARESRGATGAGSPTGPASVRPPRSRQRGPANIACWPARRDGAGRHAAMGQAGTPRWGRPARRDAASQHAAMRQASTPRWGRPARRDGAGPRAAMRQASTPRCGKPARHGAIARRRACQDHAEAGW